MKPFSFRVNVQSTSEWRYDIQRQVLCDAKVASLGGKDSGGGCYVGSQEDNFSADTDFTFKSKLKANEFIVWLKNRYTKKEISYNNLEVIE